MKKVLLTALIASASLFSFALTPAGSFVCTISSPQELTATQINTNLLKLDLESYRLYDRRTTLKFDNGFDVVMLSAVEAEEQHLIPNSGLYPEVFLPDFRMPVFHMAATGFVTAGYTAFDKKFSAIK